jgi:hypothetical protein
MTLTLNALRDSIAARAFRAASLVVRFVPFGRRRRGRQRAARQPTRPWFSRRRRRHAVADFILVPEEQLELQAEPLQHVLGLGPELSDGAGVDMSSKCVRAGGSKNSNQPQHDHHEHGLAPANRYSPTPAARPAASDDGMTTYPSRAEAVQTASRTPSE